MLNFGTKIAENLVRNSQYSIILCTFLVQLKSIWHNIECYHPHLTSLVSISIPAFWLIRLLRRGDSPLAWTWTRLFNFFICLEAVDALVVFSITLLPTGVPGCPLVVCSKRSTTSSPFCPAWIFRLVFTAVVFAWKLNTKLEIIFFPSNQFSGKLLVFTFYIQKFRLTNIGRARKQKSIPWNIV